MKLLDWVAYATQMLVTVSTVNANTSYKAWSGINSMSSADKAVPPTSLSKLSLTEEHAGL